MFTFSVCSAPLKTKHMVYQSLLIALATRSSDLVFIATALLLLYLLFVNKTVLLLRVHVIFGYTWYLHIRMTSLLCIETSLNSLK